MSPEQGFKEGKFSLVRRAESFTHAGRGIFIFFRSTHNAWIHLFVFVVAFLLALYFQISSVEWMLFILTSGLVFVAEAFNTAIEIDIDLTSPDYHPYARDTKDVASGAVLISALVAIVVGGFIFLPRLLDLLLK